MSISTPDAPHHGYTHVGYHPSFPNDQQPSWAFLPEQTAPATAAVSDERAFDDSEAMTALTDGAASVDGEGRHVTANDKLLAALAAAHDDYPDSEATHTEEDRAAWANLGFMGFTKQSEGTQEVITTDAEPTTADTVVEPAEAADDANTTDAASEGALNPDSAAGDSSRLLRARALLELDRAGNHRLRRIIGAVGLIAAAAVVGASVAGIVADMLPTIHGFFSVLPHSEHLDQHHGAGMPIPSGTEAGPTVQPPVDQIPDPFHVDHVNVGHYTGTVDHATYNLRFGTPDWAVAHYAHAHGMTLSDDPHAAAGTIDPTSHAFNTALTNFLGYNHVDNPRMMFDITRWDINTAILTNGHPLTEADIAQSMAAANA